MRLTVGITPQDRRRSWAPRTSPLSFENLSGVYLYAAFLGALPVHVAALRALLTHRRPTPPDRPPRTLAVLMGVVAWNALFVVILTLGAAGTLADG